MIWDDVVDSLDGAIREGCPTRQMPSGLVLDVPNRRGYPLLVSGATGADIEAVRTWLAGVVHDLADAHPFTFQNIPFERDGFRPVYPACDPEEFAFFNEGLVPVPYPLAWFEYEGAGATSGLLVKETGQLVELVEFSKVTVSGFTHVRVFPWVQQIYRGGPASLPAGVQPTFQSDASMLKDRETRLTKGVLDPLGLYLRGKTYEAAQMGVDPTSDEVDMVMLRESGFLVYLLVMLGSRSTETQVDQPGKFANRKRREKGLRPLPAVTTVRVVPRWIVERLRAEGEDIHASPRMHWRRSHLRTLSEGRRIVIPRCLVGFKALDGSEILEGALGHRYRVT